MSAAERPPISPGTREMPRESTFWSDSDMRPTRARNSSWVSVLSTRFTRLPWYRVVAASPTRPSPHLAQWKRICRSHQLTAFFACDSSTKLYGSTRSECANMLTATCNACFPPCSTASAKVIRKNWEQSDPTGVAASFASFVAGDSGNACSGGRVLGAIRSYVWFGYPSKRFDLSIQHTEPERYCRTASFVRFPQCYWPVVCDFMNLLWRICSNQCVLVGWGRVAKTVMMTSRTCTSVTATTTILMVDTVRDKTRYFTLKS